MPTHDRWLLPEGIEEVLPPQARRLEQLRRRLLDLFQCWGYELVVPPLIEYLEALLTGTGNDLDLQTFKLTDPLSGRLMGVSADMTPQVARIDAHYLKRNTPTRLCYFGGVLHTRPDGFARTRNPLQAGAELFGHAGIESDAEVLALMVETLRLTGIRDFHVDLGHVGIFRALASDAGLDAARESELFDALQRKALPEIEELLVRLKLDKKQHARLLCLAELNGGAEVLIDAEQRLRGAPQAVGDALAKLKVIAQAAEQRFGGVPLYFDLAELRGYAYHTGVVFAAFVPGHGQAVAQGGRYDDVGKVFGRARPATGFSTDIKTLLGLMPAAPSAARGIYAPTLEDAALHAKISELRAQGERVVMELPGQSGGARDMQCDRVLVKQNGVWAVAAAGD
ncbi:MAG: ATP phosphoribosyltransferase regulatory subunit [Gammaproteobacteria bacterium]|nr:MAG: ATP phosphoribosyltransferase regulatory subunit [Gammaproteobacteria bacterium]